MANCPYCLLSADDAWTFTEHAIAFPHPWPITPGHCAIAPRRHGAEFYDLDVQEQRAVWDLVGKIRSRIAAGLEVNRFHIGFADFPFENLGHAHIHVIPSRPGEDADLPEGVQWIADEEDSR